MKSVHNDNGTSMDGSTKTVLSINVKPGKYVVNAKAVAFYANTGAYAELRDHRAERQHPRHVLVVRRRAGQGYGTLANQAVFSVGSTGTVQLNCFGSNSSCTTRS